MLIRFSIPHVALAVALPTGLLVAATQSSAPSSRTAALPPDPRPRLAIIGFAPDPQGDPRDAWMPVACEELLARRLQWVSDLVVVPTLRLYQARRELTDPGAAPPPWPDVVRSLGARRMLAGRCRGPDNATTWELVLQDVDRPSAVQNVTLPEGRFFESLDRATRWVLAALAVPPLSEEREQRVFAPPSHTPTTVQYYALALDAARAGRNDDALRFASQALEADRRFRPALAVLAQLEVQRGPEGRASALRRLRALGDLARFENDPFDRSRAELGMSLLALSDEAFEAACTRAETALLVAFEQDDLYGQLAALTALCDSYLLRSPPGSAELPAPARATYRRQCLAHAAEWQEILVDMLAGLHDVVAGVPAANKLAIIYERLGRAPAALDMHQRTVALATEFGAPRLQATAWLYLGQCYRNQDRLAEALDAVTRCLALADEAAQPAVRVILADIYRALSLPDEAFAQLDLAYEQTRQTDDLSGQFNCLREIAGLQMQLGRREKAISALQDAIDIAHVLELRDEAALRSQLEQWTQGSP
jgi:tetratricopeptide (TPR) repeat protein